MNFYRYQGSPDYIASEELKTTVNAALALNKPLLVKGEPGTGKTLLAQSIAKSLGMELIRWNVKSTSKAQEGLYHYDVVQRLNDARFQDKDIANIRQYIKMGPIGRAFKSEQQVALLIDEIDKADIEFPNDLLNELDEMNFFIPELSEEVKAKCRPVIIITSNAEKELPDAFLRRCLFHYIAFPEPELMTDILHVHYPDLKEKLLSNALKQFYWLRTLTDLKKLPSTSELIDWLFVLMKAGLSEEEIRQGIPFLSTLVKKEEDSEKVQNRLSSRGKGS
ncbi:MAG: MoxR family ATPase [Planctomycetota bacterium]